MSSALRLNRVVQCLRCRSDRFVAFNVRGAYNALSVPRCCFASSSGTEVTVSSQYMPFPYRVGQLK